ncbi:MAG: hypothetical protein ABIH23_08675 [bacterium]
MGKQQKQSSTERMLEAVASADTVECKSLPPEFICGLRGALDAGLSCEQLTAMLVLFTGIHEAGNKMTGSELVERAVLLACTMNGDICFCTHEREQKQRNREQRKTLLEKKRRLFKGV